MNIDESIEDYRKKKSLNLIEKYKDLIEKTFTVVDLDGLEEDIKSANDDDVDIKEEAFLKRIKTRKQSLDEVVSMVDKIEELERHIKKEEITEETVSKTTKTTTHPSKRYARD